MGGKRVVVSMKASRLKSYLYFKHGTSCVSTSSVGKCASVQRRDHIPPLGHIYIFCDDSYHLPFFIQLNSNIYIQICLEMSFFRSGVRSQPIRIDRVVM